MNGLDLFSGIGGMSLALRQWVRPVCYCEIDPYCQGVLLSRMSSGDIPAAPIWDNITTMEGTQFAGNIDIVYGGFPCQGISCAGAGKGLEDERSGLFFEMCRLAKEIKPTFIFLENVPAIRSRGGLQAISAIAELGYDCRWCVISAASVGAPHLRERWFCLARQRHRSAQDAHTYSDGRQLSRIQEGKSSSQQLGQACRLRKDVAYSESEGLSRRRVYERYKSNVAIASDFGQAVANADGTRLSQSKDSGTEIQHSPLSCGSAMADSVRKGLPLWASEEAQSKSVEHESRWLPEPDVCRVVNGFPFRVDRVRALGNAVVAKQAKKAFKILMGIDNE